MEIIAAIVMFLTLVWLSALFFAGAWSLTRRFVMKDLPELSFITLGKVFTLWDVVFYGLVLAVIAIAR